MVLGILLKMIIVATLLLGAVAYLIYVERKVAAYAQDRLGPNRAGREWGIPFGLLQAIENQQDLLLELDEAGAGLAEASVRFRQLAPPSELGSR